MRARGKLIGGVVAAYAVFLSMWYAIYLVGGSLEQVAGARFFAFVVACGVCSMILVETAKRLLPVRGWYVRRMTASWFRQRASLNAELLDPVPARPTGPRHTSVLASAAMGQLVESLNLNTRLLDTGSHEEDASESEWRIDARSHGHDPQVGVDDAGAEEDASESEWWVKKRHVELGEQWQRIFLSGLKPADPFNLPIEHFLGQVSAASDHAMDRPREFTTLLRILINRLPLTDQEYLISDLTTSATNRPDDSSGDAAQRSTSRPTVEREIAFSLDQLQIWLASSWRYVIRMTSAVIAGLLGFVVVASRAFEQLDSAVYVLGAFLFGGWVAWFTRDLTAIVERLRR